DIGAGRIAASEIGGTCRRAGGHRPRIAELQALVGNCLEVGRLWRHGATVAVKIELIDTDVIDHDEQDVWRCGRVRRVAFAGAGASTPGDGGQAQAGQYAVAGFHHEYPLL